jgi:hypothetical protein
MLKIYGRANSINVRKVLWTVEEIGLSVAVGVEIFVILVVVATRLGEELSCQEARVSKSKFHCAPGSCQAGARLQREAQASYGLRAVTFTVIVPAGASYSTSSPTSAPRSADPRGLSGEASR